MWFASKASVDNLASGPGLLDLAKSKNTVPRLCSKYPQISQVKVKNSVLECLFEGLISSSSHKGVSVPGKLGLIALFRLCNRLTYCIAAWISLRL